MTHRYVVEVLELARLSPELESHLNSKPENWELVSVSSLYRPYYGSVLVTWRVASVV